VTTTGGLARPLLTASVLSSLVALSLDLPLVLEFFDTPERVDAILDRLGERMELHGVICLNAMLRR